MLYRIEKLHHPSGLRSEEKVEIEDGYIDTWLAAMFANRHAMGFEITGHEKVLVNLTGSKEVITHVPGS